MLTSPATSHRELRTETLSRDLVVIGGGLAGTCAAITAARAGLKVVLVQDRPVLGGNASSEVRLWILGATSHMGNNNRWAREGGLVDEILVENMARNPEGNPLLVDALLLEKAVAEPNLTLLLNTAVHEVLKTGPGAPGDPDEIRAVRAFCSQNSTAYELHAPLFCDASGDGIVGFLAGAAFRMGAESREEFGEKFAPTQEYGELLGHSLYFYSKDTGRPVQFTAPAFALRDITKIPRYRRFNTREYGCNLWWIEYGGRLDTVHDTEAIKWELWRVVYGVWDHIKNSGQFPEAANLTLEWVGMIPGKRESRRFEGDYLLRQQDIVEQRVHPDAVAFGGWSIDLHPADGVFSEKPGCNQWHAKGVYQIPYRCLYSRNIPNLFLAGRIISSTHVAFGSSRVMGTCACVGEAVGVAAALCARDRLLPRALGAPERMPELQRELLRIGHYIPGVTARDERDLAPRATITATSALRLTELRPDGPVLPLDEKRAMMLPVGPGPMPRLTVFTHAGAPDRLRVELRQTSRPGNHTPDVVLETIEVAIEPGTDRPCEIAFSHRFSDARYAFVCFASTNAAVDAGACLQAISPSAGAQPSGSPASRLLQKATGLRASEQRITGILALSQRAHASVATSSVQAPPEDIGVDTFEFWLPPRRPGGQNLALRLDTPLAAFSAAYIVNGIARPVAQPNAWVADPTDPAPALTLTWAEPQTIARVELSFDPDFDHPMESVLWGHPERVMPFCVRRYRVLDDTGAVLATRDDNHQARNVIALDTPVCTRSLRLECAHPSAHVPAAVFEVRCYSESL